MLDCYFLTKRSNEDANHGVKYARIRVLSHTYFPVYSKIRVRENPYSRKFYTVNLMFGDSNRR